MANDPIRVNGKQYDWGSYVFKLNGKSYDGITDIVFDQKRERTKMMGMGRDRKPVGKTRGKYEAGELKITAYTATADQIRDDMPAAAGSNSYGDAVVPATLQLVEPDATASVIEFEDVSMGGDGISGSNAENADPAKEELPFDTLAITRNGKTLYSSR